ncbi:hypothetical protein ACWWJF_00420 [Symbiopectobacterium sp. Eva_TO]
MPIYTDEPGQGINQPISNAPSGLGESLSSSFSLGFREGPFMTGLRFAEANMNANDPNSEIINKQDADARLKEYGVKSINVPDTGVTKSFLDHVIDSRRESLARQQIATAAPTGWWQTPLNFMANLAGAMADPANLAISLVPFAGEVKAASLLGRAGERFVQGARIGAVQTGVTLPFTAAAAAAEGEDYTAGNALENMFFGTIAGGALHAGGGVIADLVRSRRATSAVTDSVIPPGEAQPTPAVNPPDNLPVGIDIPQRGTQSELASAIARDADSYAYSRAYNDVMPDYIAQQQELQGGFVDNIPQLRAELADNQYQASLLGDTLNDRITQYQQERMTFRQARSRAQKDIQSEINQYSARNEEINSAIERNASAEQARGRESAISRGDIPDDVAMRIDSRATEIRQAMSMSPVAGGVRTAAQQINNAHWSVNQQAYRAALSNMLSGKAPDVEPFYNLDKPALREEAINVLRNPRQNIDTSDKSVSIAAEERYQAKKQADHELNSAVADFEHEVGLSDAILRDMDVADPAAAKSIRESLEAIRREANDDSITNAYQAFAACMINRGI